MGVANRFPDLGRGRGRHLIEGCVRVVLVNMFDEAVIVVLDLWLTIPPTNTATPTFRAHRTNIFCSMSYSDSCSCCDSVKLGPTRPL